MRLTDVTVKNLRYAGKVAKHFDDGLPNFGVRVYKSGVSFIVMLGNARKMVTLGRYPELSLKDARKRAVELLSGKTAPVELKNAESAISAFLEHVRRHNKPRTAKDYERHLGKHFPNSFDRQELLGRLDGLRRTPGEQSHATTTFQVFLNWCVHNGIIDRNPLADLRNQGRIKKRERVLDADELTRIWAQLGDDPFSITIRLMILTGQRKGEIPYFTLEDNLLTIDRMRTKKGRTHTIPVGPLTRQYFQPVRFNGWSKAKARLDASSGVADWTIHDLRRTYATVHAQLGTPIHIIEKLLNHVSGSLSGVAGIYNRYTYLDEMREAVQKYEDWVASTLLKQV